MRPALLRLSAACCLLLPFGSTAPQAQWLDLEEAGSTSTSTVTYGSDEHFDAPDHVEYLYDNGTGKTNIGPPSTFDPDMLWGNYFLTQPGGEVITQIRVAFGPTFPSLADGPVTFWLLDDPDMDLDPRNATALASVEATPDVFGNTFYHVEIPPTPVSGAFFVGASAQLQGGQDRPARVDTSHLGDRSWFFYAPDISEVINDLASAPFGTRMDNAEFVPFPGAFMIRAIGVAGEDPPPGKNLVFAPPIEQGLEVTASAGSTVQGTITLSNPTDQPIEYAFTQFVGEDRVGAHPASPLAHLPASAFPALAARGAATHHPRWTPVRGLGGPDEFGYGWIDSNEPHGPAFDDFDISDGGTEITPLLPSPGCEYSAPDEGYQLVDLPFNFPFYGEMQDQVWVSANGFLTFDPQVFQVQCSFSIHNIPSTARPNYFMAPLWADLHGYAQGRIYAEHFDDGRFVVQWTDWARFGEQGTFNTFQVILYENGEVRFQYLQVDGAFQNATRIGIENQEGTVGLLVASGGEYPEAGLAVRISAAPVFVTAVSPASGTLAPGASNDVDVTFDATSLLDGAYSGHLRIDTDEAVDGEYDYPVTLVVEGEAGCMVEPQIVDFPPTIVGNSHAMDVTVVNGGSAACTLTDADASPDDFGVAFDGDVTVPPGETASFTISFTPGQPGALSGTLTFTTTGDAITAQLQGTGVAPPEPQIDADELTFSLTTDAFETQLVTLTNAASEGAADLEFTVSLLVGSGRADVAALPPPARQTGYGSGLREGGGRSGGPRQQTAPARRGSHGDELIQDGSFEAGTPNPYWSEGSLAFGSPICSHLVGCNPNVGSGPRTGEWWLWLGGHFDFEAAYVSQSVVIPQGNAQLSFWLEMPVVPTDGFMRVLMDDEAIFEVTGADAPGYPSYQAVALDLGAHSDGQERVLRFETQLEAGSFFIDDVSLVAWVPIISVQPRDGVLPPGESVELLFTAETGEIEPGTYHFEAVIETNAPQSPQVMLPVTVTILPVGGEHGASPMAFTLEPNYPNPFTHSTTIDYSVARAGHVLIAVYDATGRRIATLVDGDREAGRHTTTWEATDLASGVYFYRIQAGSFTTTRRALLFR